MSEEGDFDVSKQRFLNLGGAFHWSINRQSYQGC